MNSSMILSRTDVLLYVVVHHLNIYMYVYISVVQIRLRAKQCRQNVSEAGMSHLLFVRGKKTVSNNH